MDGGLLLSRAEVCGGNKSRPRVRSARQALLYNRLMQHCHRHSYYTTGSNGGFRCSNISEGSRVGVAGLEVGRPFNRCFAAENCAHRQTLTCTRAHYCKLASPDTHRSSFEASLVDKRLVLYMYIYMCVYELYELVDPDAV